MNIYEAIADIMKQGAFVGKTSENTTQHFMYRGIDAVMNTFQPLLAERGVFVVPEVLEQTRETRMNSKGTNLLYSILKMRYTFYAEDGSNVSAVVIGEGMDSGDKASNKAMAVAMKYAMFQVFCIPTEEMRDADTDREAPDSMEPDQNETKKESQKKSESKKTEQKKAEEAPKQTEQTALPAPDEKGNWHCENCKGIISPYLDSKNEKHLPKEIAELSMKRTHKLLCYDCLQKEVAAAKKNAKA